MKIRDVPQVGSQGNTVTYKSRYGLVRRSKVTPRDPRTPVQVARRVALQRARVFWGTVTDDQRLAWGITAKGRRTRAVLGISGPISPYLLFVKINSRLAAIGMPMVPDPPAPPKFHGNPVVKLIVTNTRGAIAVKLQVSGQPVQYIVVLGAKPQSPGVSYVDHFTILGLLPDPDRGVSDITDDYVAKYGVPRVGSRIFIETIQQINGWQDLPKRTSALVPAP
jgi:hypothetical protein